MTRTPKVVSEHERPRTKVPAFSDLCDRSTWHGVSDWYKAKGNLPLRIFWVLAILTGFGAAIYGCYQILAQYLISPVVISFVVQPAQDGRVLPDIVICPFNRFNQSLLDQYNVSTDLLEYIQNAFSLNTPYKFQRDLPRMPENSEVLEKELKKFMIDMGNLTFGQFVDKLSYTCEGYIKYCAKPQNIYDCCNDSESVLTPVGKCYRLKGIMQVSSGFSFGMTIMIQIPQDQYLSRGVSNLHNEGVSVKLSEQDKGLDFDLTFLPTGVHAVMPLRATHFEFINHPPRYECLTDVAKSYSETQCFDDCFFEAGMNACGCKHITSQNKDPRIHPCSPDEFYSCLINKTLTAYHSEGQDKFLNRCRRRCRPPCIYWQFQPTVSYAKFPSKTLFFYVNETDDWNRTIVLDVFYEKLEYTSIKHFPSMTPDTFIANLGGQLGLWVGGSILSVIQVLAFCVHYYWAKLLNMRRKSTQSSYSPHYVNGMPCNCGHETLHRRRRQTSKTNGQTSWEENNHPNEQNVHSDLRRNGAFTYSPSSHHGSPTAELCSSPLKRSSSAGPPGYARYLSTV